MRTRQRKDGTVYTSVLYVHQGKQTSSSFNDHAQALRFQAAYAVALQIPGFDDCNI
jgi:hypothetical protein